MKVPSNYSKWLYLCNGLRNHCENWLHLGITSKLASALDLHSPCQLEIKRYSCTRQVPHEHPSYAI